MSQFYGIAGEVQGFFFDRENVLDHYTSLMSTLLTIFAHIDYVFEQFIMV